MRMTTQHELEAGMSGLAIDFRGVRDQNRKLVMGDRGHRLFDVVDAIEVGIVDAGKVNRAIVEGLSR